MLYAGFWRRFFASLIDGILIAVVPVVILAIGIAAVPTTTGTCVDQFTGATTLCSQPEGGPAAGVIIGAVVAVLVFSWLIGIRPVGRTGQSPGRKALGIRVADVDSLLPIGAGRAWGRYLTRWALSLCSILSWVDHLWMLFDPEKQTLHDKAVRSIVVAA